MDGAGPEEAAFGQVKNPQKVQCVQFLNHSPSIVPKFLKVLTSNFPNDRPFFPVFVEGSLGKSSLLESLTGVQDSFVSHDSDPDGVWAWSHPVQLQGVSLLLLKMRYCKSEEAAYLRMRRKVRACFMALSSIWCICENTREKAVESINDFVQEYGEIRAKCSGNISKVFVFVYDKWFIRPAYRTKLEGVVADYPGFFQVNFAGVRGNPEKDRLCLEEFANKLATPSLHAPYFESHQRMYQGEFCTRYITLLRVLTTIAKLDVSFDIFLRKLPDLSGSDEEIERHLQQLLTIAPSDAFIKSIDCKALEFISQKPVSTEYCPVFGDKIQCVQFLNHSPSIVPKFLDALTSNFPNDRFFFPVFVEGSLGKSSLLESLTGVQYSFVSHDSDPDGVWAWSHPVQLQEVSLLLLKMRYYRSEEAAYLEMRRKVRACFMALSSIWCICEDTLDNAIESMNAFVQEYAEIRAKCKGNVSKVFVFVKDKWCSRRPAYRTKLEGVVADNLGLFQVIYRGEENNKQDRECLEEFAKELTKPSLHAPYFDSYQGMYQGQFCTRYIMLLSTLTRIAKLDVSFDIFLRKLPDLSKSDEEIERHLQLLEIVSTAKGIQCLQFLDHSPSIVPGFLEALTSNFPNDHPFFPVFVEGSLGKSSLLQSLTGVKDSLVSQVNDPDGVWAWSHPVQLQEVSLLLLKMRNCQSEEAAYLRMRRKVRACFMALSSIWCICQDTLEKTIESMTDFVREYAEIRAKCTGNVSKVFVFVNDKWFSRWPAYRTKLEGVINDNPGLFQVKLRGEKNSKQDRECLEEFASELSEASLHAPYFDSHQSMYQGQFRTRYITLLRALTTITKLDVSFDIFLRKLPDLSKSDEEIDSHLQELRTKALSADGIKSADCRALEFITQKQVSHAYCPVFDESVLDQLQEKYQLTEPTVVFAVIGPPSSGKSTFLNHVVKYCTEAPELLFKFAIGSTGVHTTCNSQVLSHPLYLDGRQLMLIDLEGVGGRDLQDEAKATAQKKLVKAIMIVASVLVIMVNNLKETLTQAEEHIALLSKLHREFGFRTERVYLLFHDKEKDAMPNPEYAKAVSAMNTNLFSGREVVKILNKPIFPASDERTLSEFLHTLLSDCLYAKQCADGQYVNIQKLLTYLSVIARNESESLALLQLTRAENKEKSQFMEQKLSELRQLVESIVSRDDAHIVNEFDTLFRAFTAQMMQQLASRSEGFRISCRKQVDLEAKKVKNELLIRENIYLAIKSWEEEERMMEAVVASLDELAGRFGLSKSLSECEAMLKKIKSHFPNGFYKVNSTIQCFKKVTAARHSFASILINFIASHNTGVSHSDQVMTVRANELVSKWKPIKINPVIVEQLRTTPSSSSILLFIGSKKTNVAAIASSLVRTLFPLTPAQFDAFSPDSYTQILTFRYLQRRVYIVCLRMKKSGSKYADVMLNIARALLPAASLAYILSDRIQFYVEPLIDSLLPVPASASAFQKLFLYISLTESEGSPGRLPFKTLQIPYIVRYEDFSAVSMEEIKRDFDTTEVRDSNLLLAKVRELERIAGR